MTSLAESHTRPVSVESVNLQGSAEIIDLDNRLPDDDPINHALEISGIAGRAIMDISAGDQHFAVLDVSKAPAITSGYKRRNYTPFSSATAVSRRSPKTFELEDTSPYLLVHFAKDGTVTGRALRAGTSVLLGRAAELEDPKSARFDYQSDLELSRRHFTLAVDPEGKRVQVLDTNSSNGTLVRYGTEKGESRREDSTPGQRFYYPENNLSQMVKPNYENALDMDPDELWAKRANGGRSQDPNYIHNYQVVRMQMVDAFRQGDLYKNSRSFTNFLTKIHTYLGRTGDYNRLNEGDRKLAAHEHGEFRRGGRPSNGRLSQAKWTAQLADYYGDPYNANNRLVHGSSNGESVSRVALPGISEKGIAFDVTRYDEAGEIKPVDYEDYSEGGYEYFYPDSSSIPEYIDQITNLGKQIESTIKGCSGSVDDTLALIARQYQYGAVARPFAQINNSLFMQLANTQIKLLGYKGMTHGAMDIAAQRLQPDTFARYFTDRVKGHVD